jgi:hypothetical protein
MGGKKCSSAIRYAILDDSESYSDTLNQPDDQHTLQRPASTSAFVCAKRQKLSPTMPVAARLGFFKQDVVDEVEEKRRSAEDAKNAPKTLSVSDPLQRRRLGSPAPRQPPPHPPCVSSSSVA